jgi:hypothetical protein
LTNECERPLSQFLARNHGFHHSFLLPRSRSALPVRLHFYSQPAALVPGVKSKIDSAPSTEGFRVGESRIPILLRLEWERCSYGNISEPVVFALISVLCAYGAAGSVERDQLPKFRPSPPCVRPLPPSTEARRVLHEGGDGQHDMRQMKGAANLGGLALLADGSPVSP